MENTDKKKYIATFAGGCFWCTASAFDGTKGILSIESGYTGGHVEHPTYEQVCSGTTGHYEGVRITYDPDIVSYTDLLQIFFRQIDPGDDGGSFMDRGTQYRSAVFYHDLDQKSIVLDVIRKIDGSGQFERPVVTQVLKAEEFYAAEDYHQNYHKKNEIRYRYYRAGSGRDIFIDQHTKKYNMIF